MNVNENPSWADKTLAVGGDLAAPTRVQEKFVARVQILAVGQDPMILNTRCSILRSAGHIVESASSIAESLELFREADFDLVLLCHSVPAVDRDRLVCAIRASGSRIPIYTVAPISNEVGRGFADRVISSGPEELVEEVERVVRGSARSRRHWPVPPKRAESSSF